MSLTCPHCGGEIRVLTASTARCKECEAPLHRSQVDGDRWRPVGAEICADVEVEIGPGVVDAVDLIDAPVGRMGRGP